MGASGSSDLKEQIREFWERSSCGELYASGASLRERLEAQAAARYRLEPYIRGLARFPDGAGRDVLEVGVGMGADHLEWARTGPRSLTGLDLSRRAVEHTRARLRLYGFHSNLSVGDAENLPYPQDTFDLAYSWGVLHHTPDTAQAIREVWRVLRRGGMARVMLYHSRSVVGYLLWFRYALLTGRPRRRLVEIYARHLESPGTQAFSEPDGRRLFAGFSRVTVRSQLSFGDLLEGEVGQRHRGAALRAIKKVWPRRLIQKAFVRHGLLLFIEAVK